MITDFNRFLPYDLVAIGDLHGRFDLLTGVLEGLRDTQVDLLFLGDLIDRAKNPGDDLKILDLVKNLREDPEPYGLSSVDCLMGNHEDMFLEAVDGNPTLWVHNGGDWEHLPDMMHHAEWVRELPLYRLEEDKTLFVHAGVRPNVSMKQQTRNDLIWLRDTFLNSEYLNVRGVKRVVHGHTPNFFGNPLVTRERICIDTGAFSTGILTLYNHRSGELIRVEE